MAARAAALTGPRGEAVDYGALEELVAWTIGWDLILATFTSIDVLAELVKVGTLFAFILVSLGVILLRKQRPDLKRAFRVPLVPLLPALSVLICFYVMLNPSVETWIRFVVWMALGLAVYFLYGRHHRRVGLADRQKRTGT